MKNRLVFPVSLLPSSLAPQQCDYPSPGFSERRKRRLRLMCHLNIATKVDKQRPNDIYLPEKKIKYEPRRWLIFSLTHAYQKCGGLEARCRLTTSVFFCGQHYDTEICPTKDLCIGASAFDREIRIDNVFLSNHACCSLHRRPCPYRN